jgi:hypothetical protein
MVYRKLSINQSEYQSMRTNTYGVIVHSGEFIAVKANTLACAKSAATRNRYPAVALRSPLGYNIEIVARRVHGVWRTD